MYWSARELRFFFIITATYAGTFVGAFDRNHTAADVNVLAFLPMTSDARISTIGISSCKPARSGSLAIDVDGVFVVNQAVGCKGSTVAKNEMDISGSV